MPSAEAPSATCGAPATMPTTSPPSCGWRSACIATWASPPDAADWTAASLSAALFPDAQAAAPVAEPGRTVPPAVAAPTGDSPAAAPSAPQTAAPPLTPGIGQATAPTQISKDNKYWRVQAVDAT